MAPTARTERALSIFVLDDTLERLLRINNDLTSPSDVPDMPTPVPARAGPSMVRQLEDILPRGNIPSSTPLDPPQIVPFSYQRGDRSERIRSPSPVSMDTPPLRQITVPVIHGYIAPSPLPSQRPRPYAPRATEIRRPPRFSRFIRTRGRGASLRASSRSTTGCHPRRVSAGETREILRESSWCSRAYASPHSCKYQYLLVFRSPLLIH